MPDAMTPQQALRRYFGYDSFRPGQDEIVDAIRRNPGAVDIDGVKRPFSFWETARSAIREHDDLRSATVTR